MTFKVGGEAFTYTWHSLLSRGWVEMMPWRLDDLKLNLLDETSGAATLAAWRARFARGKRGRRASAPGVATGGG